MIREAIVIATKEKLKVYKLEELNQWADYENMGANLPPAAPKSGKKKFHESELELGKEII